MPFQDTIPVFTWVTTPAHSDIMFPGPMPWTQGISEPGPEHMKQAPADGRPLPGAPPSVTPHPGPASASASGAADTASAAQSPDFDPSDPRWPRWSPQDIYRCDKKLADRKPAAFWRGGLTGPTVGYKGGVMKHYQRVRAGLLSSEHPTLIDASLTGVDGLEAEFPDETSHFLWPHARDTSNGGECEHRYNLNIAGEEHTRWHLRLAARTVTRQALALLLHWPPLSYVSVSTLLSAPVRSCDHSPAPASKPCRQHCHRPHRPPFRAWRRHLAVPPF